MATYVVEYLGKNLATNLDAVACGLRVLRLDQYFQYFMPLVSGPSLGPSRTQDERWWPALVAVGIEEITEIVNADFRPKPDPTQAFHFAIAAGEVERRAKSGGDLPELIDGLFAGHPVASFEGP
jgi:hypothetical protein